MTSRPASYRGYRLPLEIISHAVFSNAIYLTSAALSRERAALRMLVMP